MSFKGKKHSLESRRKMSESKQGNQSKRGKKHSLESRRKMSESRRGERNINWKGGRTPHSKGYIRILMPNHPRADCNGYVFEHILVLENKLKRPLLPGEESHHINGIRDDNRQENLTVFASKSKHTMFHNNERKQAWLMRS